jgi:hypothetical protein
MNDRATGVQCRATVKAASFDGKQRVRVHRLLEP